MCLPTTDTPARNPSVHSTQDYSGSDMSSSYSASVKSPVTSQSTFWGSIRFVSSTRCHGHNP